MRGIACIAVVLGTLLCPAGLLYAEGTFDLVGIHPDAAVQPTSMGNALAALTAFNNKIYAGFGDYNINTGPIGIRAFDPATNTFSTQLLNSTTEAIYQFRHIGGKLYAPDIDPQAGLSNGGYAIGTANGITEVWQHKAPVAATHVYDMADYGGSLWMAGSLDNNAVVWRSTDNGVTWSISLNVPPSGGYSFVRVYGMCVYNDKLYANVDAEATKSRIFDGTSWSDGPDLTPSGGFMSDAGTFAGFMIYRAYECGLGATKMYKFNGTSASDISNNTFYDYKIVGDGMYGLIPDTTSTPQGILVKRTVNLVDWQTIAAAPITSRSLAIRGDRLFVGATNGELYKYSEPVPDAQGPALQTSIGTFTATIFIGEDAASESFTITNLIGGTVSYTITSDAGWLSVTPESGSVAGETDTIAVNYTSRQLAPGIHNGTLMINDDSGLSPLAGVSVSLTVKRQPSDFDSDGDVDQEDFGHLQACMLGPLVYQNDPVCQDCKLNDGYEVDQLDLAIFMRCFEGPGILPETHCSD